MGYRARLGRIPKTAKEKYAGKSLEEVVELMGSDDWYSRPPEYEELYEMGKYLDWRGEAKPFYDFDIMEEAESEFHIMSKEDLKVIIEHYHKIIKDNYDKLLKEFQAGKPENEWDEPQVERFFKEKVHEWKLDSYFRPYYLDEEKTDGFIVRSWKWEYAIFNIVYIYKTFDWENDYLIYSAW